MTQEPIAICSLALRFPGASSPEEFWQNVVVGRDALGAPPEGRWRLDPATARARTPAEPDRVAAARAGFVDDVTVDPRDAGDLDPAVLAKLDPLARLVLSVGGAAFRAARMDGVDRARVGVILANIALPTDGSSALAREVYLDGANETAAPLDRYVMGLPAGLLARALGLSGGAFALDAACASSLYAIKLACDELRARRLDAVLAGGASRPDALYTAMGFSQLRAQSPSGVCSPFDAKGDGLVVGEGAGLFVLKRLDDAVRAGDTVLGVVRAVGLSNDVGGKLLAPDSEGQLRAMRSAYEQAGWDPKTVELIECHATGTPVGDAVEVASLRELWGATGWQPGQCVLGGVKALTGHLLTGAGAVGLAKVLLALKNEALPPVAHFERAAPGVALEGGPFATPREPRPWKKRPDRARRAAVSAFGFGGINAHLLVEEFTGPLPGTPSPAKRGRAGEGARIAVIGMGAHFGSLRDLRAFQHAVLGGESALVPRSPARWGKDGPALEGAWIDEVEVAPGEFRIPPNEIKELLPQQLLALAVARAALEDATLGKRERRLRAGVVVGLGLDLNTTNYHLRWALERLAQERSLTAQELASLKDTAHPALNATRTQGALGGMIASRIAREFDLGGPSFGVSCEDASGLRALELAARALARGELDLALATAVDVAGDPRAVLATDRLRAFTRGRPRPFDKAADGTAPGEGAACVVLKRLEDALRDGDRIYATLRGFGAASGGAIAGISSSEGRVKAFELACTRAYEDAGVPASSVTLIEGHGSGHPDEDAVEAAVLAKLRTGEDRPCALASVKPIVGHAGAASGLASVVSAALALFHEVLPPLPGYESPRAELEGSNYFVPRETLWWFRDRAKGPRRAGVSALSIDGTAHHVVLEGLERKPTDHADERARPTGPHRLGLFVVERDDPAGLLAGLDALIAFSEAARDEPVQAGVEDLARTWLARTGQHPERARAVAIVAEDATTLAQRARDARDSIARDPEAAIDARGLVRYSPQPMGRAGEVAFVFPGSGAHYVGMGAGLGVAWPEPLRELDATTGNASSQSKIPYVTPYRLDWAKGWREDARKVLLADPHRTLLGQVTHGVVVSDVLRHLGMKPNAAIGYSLGETAAFFAMKAWHGARDEMLVRIESTPIFRRDLGIQYRAARSALNLREGDRFEWVVGLVNRPKAAVLEALSAKDRAFLLIVNAPDECVIGGDRPQVEAVLEELGTDAMLLDGVVTVHCKIAGVVEDAYRELHTLPTVAPEGIRFYSGALARSYPLDSKSAAHSITEQAIHGFDFPQVIEQAYQDGVRVFVECGPQGTTARAISKILGTRPHAALTACVRGRDEVDTILRALARLVAERVPVDLQKVCGPSPQGSRREVPKGSAIKVPTASARVVKVPPALPRGLSKAEHEHEHEREREAVKKPVEAMRAPAPVEVVRTPVARVPSVAVASEVDVLAPAAAARGVISAAHATAQAHDAYLELATRAQGTLAQGLALQARLYEMLLDAPGAAEGFVEGVENRPQTRNLPEVREAPPRAKPWLDYAACLEFAKGKIGNVLGEKFAPFDAHPTRVRLPDEPLMLCHRITSVTGEPLSLSSGTLVTEHDVEAGAWYLDNGRAPVCISVEAGQADLFLSAWLGIDRETKGERRYRLLDAVIAFHRHLPVPGETIRYEITIDRFIRQGNTYLFFFRFDGYVGTEKLLTMREGCAGFFSQEQLANSLGIVLTPAETDPVPGKVNGFAPLVPVANETLDATRVDALRRGDLAAAFGGAFAGLPLSDPVRLPGATGRMKLIDRVVALEPRGGRFGLGLVRAEADIHPDDWFLTCHFVDDKVMPGTLMYECCLHTLRVWLSRMGWVGEHSQIGYEPIPEVGSRLRCRGQVTVETKVVTYEIHVKEIGYGPEPYAIADALMFADGKRIVRMESMSVRLTGLTKESLEAMWAGRASAPAATPVAIAPSPSRIAPHVPVPLGPKTPIFDVDRITAFAIGKPSDAFGEPYRVFDGERTIARLPGPPYQFLDRVTDVSGATAWKLEAGAWIEAQYDVPADAWYFAANRQRSMPFSVLLEVALQPCGWLAAYLGSALRSSTDLSFRNLGGKAVQHLEVFPDSGTLTIRVKLTTFSEAAGMIVQKYDLEVFDRHGRSVYSGDTSFGFFSKQALAQQVGVRGAKERRHAPSPEELSRATLLRLPDEPDGIVDALVLPAPRYRMIEDVLVVKDGGPNGLGYARGETDVHPDAWFFQAHFYQDPVWPGSLGLESFLQILKKGMIERWPHLARSHRFEPIALGTAHTWAYRGQIVPRNERVLVDAVVTQVEEGPQPLVRANGFLSVDGIIIYEMTDFALRLVPSHLSQRQGGH